MCLINHGLFQFLLLLSLHHPVDVWQKAFEEFLSILDVFVHIFDLMKEQLPLLSHVIDILFADATKFVTNVSLSYNICSGLITCIFHLLIESVPLVEPSDKCLHSDDYLEEKPHLTLSERFIIVVLFSANGACAIITSIFLKSLETFYASLVKHMGTTKNLLLLHM